MLYLAAGFFILALVAGALALGGAAAAAGMAFVFLMAFVVAIAIVLYRSNFSDLD